MKKKIGKLEKVEDDGYGSLKIIMDGQEFQCRLSRNS